MHVLLAGRVRRGVDAVILADAFAQVALTVGATTRASAATGPEVPPSSSLASLAHDALVTVEADLAAKAEGIVPVEPVSSLSRA